MCVCVGGLVTSGITGIYLVGVIGGARLCVCSCLAWVLKGNKGKEYKTLNGFCLKVFGKVKIWMQTA